MAYHLRVKTKFIDLKFNSEQAVKKLIHKRNYQYCIVKHTERK